MFFIQFKAILCKHKFYHHPWCSLQISQIWLLFLIHFWIYYCSWNVVYGPPPLGVFIATPLPFAGFFGWGSYETGGVEFLQSQKYRLNKTLTSSILVLVFACSLVSISSNLVSQKSFIKLFCCASLSSKLACVSFASIISFQHTYFFLFSLLLFLVYFFLHREQKSPPFFRIW